MGDEVLYVDRFRVRDGRAEDFDRFARDMARFVEDNEPGVTFFRYHLDDGGTSGTAVFVFSDAAALDRHLELAAPRFQEAMDLIDTAEMELLGRPSEQAAEMVRSFNGTVRSRVVGFSRSEQTV